MIPIYIGAAIDNSKGSPEDQFDALSKLVTEGLDGKVVIYNPLRAFHNAAKVRTPETNHYVVKVNTEALHYASLAVFSWTDSPSFGVPLEIDHRVRAGRPFIIWNRSDRHPGIYMEHAAHQCGRIVDSPEQLVEALQSFRDNPKSWFKGAEKCQDQDPRQPGTHQ